MVRVFKEKCWFLGLDSGANLQPSVGEMGSVGTWRLEQDIDQIPNKISQVSIDRRSLDVGKNPSRFFAVPIFFRSVSLPGLAQKPANVSPTVWNIGIAGKFQPLFHFQVTIVYIFSFFTSFPPKKKQTTLWRDELFPVFFFPPRTTRNRNPTNPPLNLGGRAAPSGSLLSPGGVFPKRSL